MRTRDVAIVTLLAGLAVPGAAVAQEIESAAVRYLKPPAIALGAVEIAVSAVGAGFHFDSAWTLTGDPELEDARGRHIASGILAISRVAAVAPSIGALAGADTMDDIFWGLGPPYLVVGAIDLAGAILAIDSAVKLSETPGSTPEAGERIARSRTINQGWGVSVAVLSGVELVLGVATTLQGLGVATPVAVRVLPTPGGFAIAGRFGAPRWNRRP